MEIYYTLKTQKCKIRTKKVTNQSHKLGQKKKTKAISNRRIELIPYCVIPIHIPRYLVFFINFSQIVKKTLKY